MTAFDAALNTATPGNWTSLTELYASPKDLHVQAELKAWLDQYASNARQAMRLLDARDDAAPGADLHAIARRVAR